MNNDTSFNPVYDTDNFYFGLDPSEELAEFVENGGLSPHSYVLDLGCGEGRDSLFLASKGHSVLAVDISKSAIEKLDRVARRRHLPVETLCADASTFSCVARRQYDLVLAVTFLDHLPEDVTKVSINQIKACVRPGGFTFIEVFTVQDPGFIHMGDESECARQVKHYFRCGELRSVFEDWQAILYEEKHEIDTSHGPVHNHHVAILIAQKPIDTVQ